MRIMTSWKEEKLRNGLLKVFNNNQKKMNTMENLKYNGKEVRSITLTESAKIAWKYSNSMLINGHVIKGISKEDCLTEFENNREKYDDCFKNSVEYFIAR